MTLHHPKWRKSSRSQQNGSCVEVACLHDASWRKSSRSQANGSCVEVAHLDGVIGIRDTKQHGIGPILTISAAEFAAFVNAITTQ